VDKLAIGTGDWVVVCDGRKALVLENAGDSKFPNLKVRQTYEQPNEPTRELGAQPPGRTHQSVGAARSAVEQTDWHDRAERSFLKELADRLDKAVTGGETQRLIMVAAPRALGMIRPEYSAALSRAIEHEIEKDLVKMPVDRIEQHLTSAG
jgi:protein required for attachment to host cells